MRLLVISDTHCGATSGLTPPGYQHEELAAMQKPFWNWFSTTLEKYKPFDGLLGLGDYVDGEGKKGTLDTAITDIRKQAEAAAAVLTSTGVPNKRMFLVRGTPFHTAGATEYEDILADLLPNCLRKNVQ